MTEQRNDQAAATTLRFRVERTQYAEIEVDVAALLAEWGKERAEFDGTDDEFVRDALWEIGVQDLMWSGDFIKVYDEDTEEDIRALGI
jgi:hypothetical protein